MRARSISAVVSPWPNLWTKESKLQELIGNGSVIENKDAIKALNVIHESCLSYPRSPATEMAGLQLQ